MDEIDKTSARSPDLWLPQIDGLRAIAIIAVLIHHGNTVHFSNWAVGNSGVVIFFSISGFLAYYVLYRDELRYGKIDYGYFLLRRILRIWPAYFLVIGTAFYLASPEQRAVANQWPLFTFTANFYQAAHLPSQLQTLGVLWSIAIEEQFYLVAPLMYYALRSRNWLAFSIGVFLVANFVRVACAIYFDGSIYYLSLTYLDIFWAGALVAKWHATGGRISSRAQNYLFTGTAIVIVLIPRMWGPNVGPPYTVSSLLPYPILAVAAATLLISLLENQGAFGRLFSSTPMRFAGRLSYSLYLVHVSIIMFLVERMAIPSNTLLFNLAYAGISLPIAMLLHYCWERLFLKIKDHVKPPIGLWPAAACWTMVGIGCAASTVR